MHRMLRVSPTREPGRPAPESHRSHASPRGPYLPRRRPNPSAAHRVELIHSAVNFLSKNPVAPFLPARNNKSMLPRTAKIVWYARRTAVLVAALAIMLPLPSRCTACTTGHDHCAKCAAENTSTEQPAASCCRAHAPQSQDTSGARSLTLGHAGHTCGCGMQSVPPTTPPQKSLTIAAPELAALATPTGFDIATLSPLPSRAFEVAPLAVPIPHRILHCSWII